MTDVVPPQARPAAAPLARPEASSVKLAATLGIAGGLAGLLLVFVYQLTQPRILAHKAAVLKRAIEEVLGAPERYETLYVLDDRLAPESEAGPRAAGLDRVYLGYREGKPVGFAVVAQASGYQDVIRVIFGYEAGTKRILGMKVLESKETPGLGDKIEKDRAFVDQFQGVGTPLIGVKSGEGTGEPGQVDMITGATISARTVIKIINTALERLGPLMEAHQGGEDAR